MKHKKDGRLNKQTHNTSDHELMLAVKEGDLDALAPLFEKYHKSLYNLFLYQTQNVSVSEDLVQDVFFRMLKSRHTYRGDGKFTTWMYSVAHSARMDYFRKKKYKTSTLEDAPPILDSGPTPAEHVEKQDEVSLLHLALERLPDEKREVLVLSRFKHMKYEEIAEILGCAVGTIKARVHHALKDLSVIYTELTGECAS